MINQRDASKRNLYILTFVLLVALLGYGIVIPILPFYIESMGAGGTELGLLVASYAIMRLFCGPVWGSLSDRVGRKPILLIGILGNALAMVWFGLATQLWMLFAARILSGILSSATSPTTMAYIGDSTPEKERGGGMGLLGAAGGIGTILGPALGGFLGGETLSIPFFVAAGLSFISLLLALIFLPESLPKTERQKAEDKKNILDMRLWMTTIRSPLGLLFLLTFISTCGLMIFANVFGLYALERFSYGTQEVGVMMMVLGLVSALAQGALAGPLTARWGDERIIKSGLLLTAIGFILMLLANTYLNHPAHDRPFRPGHRTASARVVFFDLETRHGTPGCCHGAEQFLRQPGAHFWASVRGYNLRCQYLFALPEWLRDHGNWVFGQSGNAA